MEELNMMLADLASEGAVDSSGEFTLSLARAKEKLAAFRLANPALFILNLVAAAVAGGATRFAVETRESATTFTFDSSVTYSDEELQGIFGFILQPTAPAHLRELALALHGARSLPGDPQLALLVGERSLQVDGDSVELVRDVSASTSSRLLFRLIYPDRGFWSRVVSPTDSRGGNVMLNLFHYCRFAPLAFLYNGQSKGARLTLGVYDTSVFAHRYLKGSQPMKVVGAERRYDLFLSSKRKSPVASSIAISLGTPQAVQTHGLILISRGVTFGRAARELGFPLAIAAVSADHLEKNLSQSDLVEDAAYHELMAALRAEVDDLVLELCASPPPAWNASVARLFANAVEQRYPDAQTAPLAVQAFHRLHAMKETCQTEEGRQEQMEFWRTLVVSDEATAKKFGSGLSDALERLAKELLSIEVWGGAFDCLLHQCELKGDRPTALQAVLLVLADREEQARSLYAGGLDDFPASLAYLLGWRDAPQEEGVFTQFARFQKAVEAAELEAADHLAGQLEQCHGNSMLFLWLGWYAVFRGRYDQAAALWETALEGGSGRQRQRWAEMLWPELRGKTSFLVQVRWQVRRGWDEIERSMGNSHEQAIPPADLSLWVRKVWQTRQDGDAAEADREFRRGFLSSLVLPHAMRLDTETFIGTRLLGYHPLSRR
jgi:hypothetical protein